MMVDKAALTRQSLQDNSFDDERSIKDFARVFKMGVIQAPTPQVALELVSLALGKVAKKERRPSWDPFNDLFQDIGLHCYETLNRVGDDLKARKAHGEDIRKEADQIIDLTKQLLTEIFFTTEDEIAEGLKEYREKMNATS